LIKGREEKKKEESPRSRRAVCKFPRLEAGQRQKEKKKEKCVRLRSAVAGEKKGKGRLLKMTLRIMKKKKLRK